MFSHSSPLSKKVFWGLIVLAILVFAGILTTPVAGKWFSTNILGEKNAPTQAECLAQKERGIVSDACSIVFQGQTSEWYSATPAAFATSLPFNGNSNAAQCQSIGAKCLNNEACCSGNCIQGPPEMDGGPSKMRGNCGCRPRPACLNANPPCMIPETDDMCVCGNRQCEAGEKKSCPEDCGATTPPTKCVPEGQDCLGNGECGTCGAVCLAGKCIYQEKKETTELSCDYPAPPEGCQYVAPVKKDPNVLCDLILQCDGELLDDVRDEKPLECPDTVKCGAPPQGCGYLADKNDPCGCGKLVDLQSCAMTNSVNSQPVCSPCTSTQESSATCAEKGYEYICTGGISGKNFCSKTDQTTPQEKGTVINDGIVCKKTFSPSASQCAEEGKACANTDCCGDLACAPDYIPEPGVNYFRAPIDICQKKSTEETCSSCLAQGDAYLCATKQGSYCSDREGPDSTLTGVHCRKCEKSTVSRCHYSAPREGCSYVPGPQYDAETDCGKIEQCSGSEEVFCTEDAKQCLDGSYVARDPRNNCAFAPCPDAQPQNCPVIKGDFNCDARVDIADLVKIADYLAVVISTLTPQQADNADMNYDGHVDVLDLVQLFDKLTLSAVQ